MLLDKLCETHGRTLYAIISKLTALGILVEMNRNYHLVNPDPWVLGRPQSTLSPAPDKVAAPVVKALQRRMLVGLGLGAEL
jgi:hypothetical protein